MAKAPAIPYCTVKAFRAALDILRTAPPTLVTRDSLVERGISAHAVYPVLGALRFLALIDDEGVLQPNVAAFLEPNDIMGRRRIFEQSFAFLLPDIKFPVDEREDMDRLLVENHGVAQGVAAFCATFFLWLAAESGVPVADAGRVRRGRPPAHLAQLSDAARAALLGQAMDADLDAFIEPGAIRPTTLARPARPSEAQSKTQS